MNDYFEKILQAKVYEVAKKTPLEKAHNLSNSLNNEVFLKREDLQDVFLLFDKQFPLIVKLLSHVVHLDDLTHLKSLHKNKYLYNLKRRGAK